MSDKETDVVAKAGAYTEAMSTFRHYDTLSAIAIGAIPASAIGICTALHGLEPSPWRAGIPLEGAIFVGIAFRLYLRLDLHAATALKVAACLERAGKVDGEAVHGLASAREDLQKLPSLSSRNEGVLFKWALILAIATASSFLILAGISIGSPAHVL